MGTAEQWERPMADMVQALFDGVQKARTGGLKVRARSLEMDLPVEVSLQETGGETTFIAHLPVWRWRTDFDRIPGRLRMTWEEELK